MRKLGPGREFDLIRSFFPEAPAQRIDIQVGAGDDAAVVRGQGIVLSADLSVEDVHFRRDWLTPQQIGFRAATAALSDLAAMAARPIGVLASLAVRDTDAGAMAPDVMAGVRAAVHRVGGVLLGGDLTASPGPLVLDVIAVGEAKTPLLRTGAQAGDELWVTGSLGGAALAVRSLLAGRPVAASTLARYLEPTARVEEARWLSDRNLLRAMLDLSDGLAGDAGHLARASGVAILIDAAAVPVQETLRAELPAEQALQLALSGGEDYELLFAAAAGTVSPHREEFEATFRCSLTRVGAFRQGEGVYLRSLSGDVEPLVAGGFQHF